MFKLIHNNQIIDVLKTINYVKCLPKSKRLISVDKKQANGVVSSDGDTIYHIIGTRNTFADEKLKVEIVPIEEEEYLYLTTQLKENQKLEARIKELEILVQKLQESIKKN